MLFHLWISLTFVRMKQSNRAELKLTDAETGDFVVPVY